MCVFWIHRDLFMLSVFSLSWSVFSTPVHPVIVVCVCFLCVVSVCVRLLCTLWAPVFYVARLGSSCVCGYVRRVGLACWRAFFWCVFFVCVFPILCFFKSCPFRVSRMYRLCSWVRFRCVSQTVNSLNFRQAVAFIALRKRVNT